MTLLKPTWRHGPDMPVAMAGPVQAVLIQGKVYVGGGSTAISGHYDCIVMKYDTDSEEWETLPLYKASHFGMTALNDQLVLIGGNEEGGITKILGVWSGSAWAHPLPPMPTARYSCSAISYDKWLIVAGGCNEYFDAVSSVEILNTTTNQWYAALSTPVPWADMRTTIICDTCYFMGGFVDGLPTTSVYSVSVQALLHTKSNASSQAEHIWHELPPLTKTASFPFSFDGSLLAAGGVDEDDDEAVKDIHLYLPNCSEWIKVGDLLSPCYDSACTMISNRELFISGGSSHPDVLHSRTNIANFALQ